MLTAINNRGSKFISLESNKDMLPLYCPHCNSQVGLRKGTIKIHHFYHLTNYDCVNAGESLDHMEHKYELYIKFKRIYLKTEMEYYLNDCIADVYIPELNIAFEVQRSALSKEVFWERTQKYIDKKIRVFWIFLEKDLPLRYDKNSSPSTAYINIKQMHKAALRLYTEYIYVYNKSRCFIRKYYLKDKRTYHFDEDGYPYDYIYKTKKNISSIEEIYNDVLKDFSKGLV